ncbi:MAG: mechanosensitive ion channel family protein, partial [Deltaproteobacteria bacterium]
EPVVPEFPGLSELGNRQAQVVELLRRAQADVEPLGDVAGLQQRLLETQKNLDELRTKVAGMGEPDDWYVDQLLQVNNAFRSQQKSLEALQAELTGRQQIIEKWRTDIRQEAEFWQSWRSWLKKNHEKVPEKTFRRAADDLSRQDKALQALSARLLKLQDAVVAGIKEVGGELDRFSQALDKLRKATFRKNAPSFVSPDFYRQFKPDLWSDAVRGARNVLIPDKDYLTRNGWLLGLLVLILVAGALLIRTYRQQLIQTREWLFFLRHPWAASGFVAIVATSPFFSAPPPLFRLLFLALGVFAAARLAGSLLENRRQVRVLYLAALLLVTTTAFRLVALPQPFYRLYIAFLALLALPLLIQQIRQSHRQRSDGGGRLFRGLLRISMVVLLASLVSQVSGYMNFSFWLLQATFETGMVVLFAHMALRIGNGGIRFLLSRFGRAERAFLRTFGEELAQRLGRLLRLAVVCYGALYLLPTWRIFGSVGQAWDFFSALSFRLGTADISFRMVVLALLSLYLAMQISWLLQTLTEVQVFEPRRIDRGVRDAVKKLMHYGIVLIGLLFALSSLGMSLQNFVVVLGALGVGIGFGLQDIVNNFLSGLILLFERPVKVGDFIVVNNEWGDIKKIGLRSTVVETIDHSEIIVPNSQLISEKVTNWTLSSRVARLVVPVGVAYGSDVEQVMRILTEVATGHPEAVQYPPPSILFVAFGESSLDFEIRVFVRDISARFRIRSDMLRQIDARFREAGIEIPFPQRDLHLRS